jgi:hypothetical protein
LLFKAAVETAQRIWQIDPVWGIRMPEPNAQQTVEIDVLWTDSGLRPRANNLAFLIQQVSNREDLELWKQRLQAWTVRGGLLVLDELYLVQPKSNSSSELKQEQLDLDSWYQTLISSKPHLFTPKALSNLKQGQLSLADLEERVSERSFTFLARQQTQIDTAFQKGINAAIRVVQIQGQDSYSTRIQGHIIRYSIAYLAARILQDKNFFGSGASIHGGDQDPITLLDQMIDLTNGFFHRAKQSEEFIHEHARTSFDRIRQELVRHMGYNVSFVLTDHRDVGRLYEEAIKKLPRELGSGDWGDLNRHYTPVKLAERMLEALPLERLRPEERFIFDPAAGSGSLLLAATSRLAGMRDIPAGDARKAYLRRHVAGNDLDRYASLIAQLRYFIASESLGRVSQRPEIFGVLPFPIEANFTHKDYEALNKNDLPIKPNVIIANPPFVEEGKTQKSAKFVQKALEWLDDGSQFAFVLPQSFLAGTDLGFSEARKLLDERCQILEVWQLPEHSVGINAEQAVCVVIGAVSPPQKIFSVSSKAVFSRVKEEVKYIREDGFLGTAWCNRLASENLEDKDQLRWLLVAPPVSINIKTFSLGELFYVFNGVNPGKFNKLYPPESEQQPGIPYKRNWRLKYRDVSKLWADPERVPQKARWIRYGKDYLVGHRPGNEALFDLSKILVARKVNRGSNYPLAALFDDTGFCPDNNVYCVLPAVDVNKYTSGYQAPNSLSNEWLSLSYEDKCLWLLGICISRVANSLSLVGRKTHEITVEELCRLPLPAKIDKEIIQITHQIIDLEKRRDSWIEEQVNALRQMLDQLVEKSYGNPSWREITRVGKSPELSAWQEEQKKKTLTVIGQVLACSQDKEQVLLRLSGLLDDNEEEWLPLPQELPGWALNGTVFEAQLSEDIETFQELSQRPWGLRKFRHTPYPYLTHDDLKAKVSRIAGLEHR